MSKLIAVAVRVPLQWITMFLAQFVTKLYTIGAWHDTCVYILVNVRLLVICVKCSLLRKINWRYTNVLTAANCRLHVTHATCGLVTKTNWPHTSIIIQVNDFLCDTRSWRHAVCSQVTLGNLFLDLVLLLLLLIFLFLIFCTLPPTKYFNGKKARTHPLRLCGFWVSEWQDHSSVGSEPIVVVVVLILTLSKYIWLQWLKARFSWPTRT